MDLPLLVKKYDMNITGILHVGAHLAEESPVYDALGVSNVLWVEANPDLVKKVSDKVSHIEGNDVVQALVYSEPGVDLGFNITNVEGMSSSIYEFGTHSNFSPEIVYVDRKTLTTSTIDELIDGRPTMNMLNIDIQGAELEALKGADAFLKTADYIMSEVNNQEVYIGCAKVGEIDSLLRSYGFMRIETYWVPGQGWGDAFYVKLR